VCSVRTSRLPSSRASAVVGTFFSENPWRWTTSQYQIARRPRATSRIAALAFERRLPTSIVTRCTITSSTLSVAGSDRSTRVVSTETRTRPPSAAATARHWTPAALISGKSAPVTSSTRGGVTTPRGPPALSLAAASRSSPTSVLVRLIEGTNQHVMKKPRRAAHVELGRDPVEPLADVEGAVAPATYEGAQRRRDGAHVLGWRDRTPKPSKQAGRGPRLRGQTKNRPAKREIVNQFAR